VRADAVDSSIANIIINMVRILWALGFGLWALGFGLWALSISGDDDFDDEYGFWPPYMFIWLPGSNDTRPGAFLKKKESFFLFFLRFLI
jgi:hypothetical protein